MIHSTILLQSRLSDVRCLTCNSFCLPEKNTADKIGQQAYLQERAMSCPGEDTSRLLYPAGPLLLSKKYLYGVPRFYRICFVSASV